MTHWCQGCCLLPLLTLQGPCFLCSLGTDAAWLWSLCLRVSNENSSTSSLPVPMCLFLEAGPGDLHHTSFSHTLPVPQIIATPESSHFPPSCKSVYANSHLGIIQCTVLLSTLLRVSLHVCYISIPAHGRLYIIYSQSREMFTNWFITASNMKQHHLISCSWREKKDITFFFDLETKANTCEWMVWGIKCSPLCRKTNNMAVICVCQPAISTD